MHAQHTTHHGAVQADAHRVQLNGEPVFEVQASGFVRTPVQAVWRILTDYERLPEFVPDLLSSRLVSRNGNEAVIEQRSQSGFLFLTVPIYMKLHIVEHPQSAIDVTLLAGDMHHYEGHWEIEPAMQNGLNGTHISFHSTLEPSFFLPPLFGTSIVQGNVRKMVEAVVTEIERKGAH